MSPTYTTPAIILDCDIRSQEGVIQPLGREGVPIIALSSREDCPAFHSKYVSQTIHSPSLNESEEQYVEFLEKLPQKGVLIYSNDLSAVVISKHQQRLKEAGFLLNISEHEKLVQLFDKWRCYQLARSLEIPMAKSQRVESLEDIFLVWDEFEKPVLLKGTRMAGGEYPKITKREEVEAAWNNLRREINSTTFKARKSDILLQEWHEYDMTDNWSCESIFTQESNPIGFFTIQRTRCSLNDDGTFASRLFAGHYEQNDQLVVMTKKILSSMNWRGFAHVEYFYVPRKKKFFLTEVNPRLPGYSYYPGTAGFNLAYYYYLDLIGRVPECPTAFPKSYYFEAFFYPGDITEACIHIPKGHLNIFSFLSSYLAILRPACIRILDPIRLDDPAFSIQVQLQNMQRFSDKATRFCKKLVCSR